jgi:hypothetical protein
MASACCFHDFDAYIIGSVVMVAISWALPRADHFQTHYLQLGFVSTKCYVCRAADANGLAGESEILCTLTPPCLMLLECD